MLKKFTFILILICCLCSCNLTATYDDYCKYDNLQNSHYKQQIDKQIDNVIKTSKIKRDGHTYIVFHNTVKSYRVVHDPDCCGI